MGKNLGNITKENNQVKKEPDPKEIENFLKLLVSKLNLLVLK